MSKIYSRPRIRIPNISIKNFRGGKSKNKKKFIKIIFLIIIVFIIFKNILDAITPIFDALCKNRAKSIAIVISNAEVAEVMKQYKYDDIFTLEKDKNDNIKMIKANVNVINTIKSDIAVKIQEKIDERGDENVGIAIGSLTGIRLLSGRGYNIPIKISTIGNVKTDLKSEFTQEGINQTLHRVYLQVETEVNILTPYNAISEDVTNQILIAENVIMGNIPETYYNINGTSLEQDMQFTK